MKATVQDVSNMLTTGKLPAWFDTISDDNQKQELWKRFNDTIITDQGTVEGNSVVNQVTFLPSARVNMAIGLFKILLENGALAQFNKYDQLEILYLNCNTLEFLNKADRETVYQAMVKSGLLADLAKHNYQSETQKKEFDVWAQLALHRCSFRQRSNATWLTEATDGKLLKILNCVSEFDKGIKIARDVIANHIQIVKEKERADEEARKKANEEFRRESAEAERQKREAQAKREKEIIAALREKVLQVVKSVDEGKWTIPVKFIVNDQTFDQGYAFSKALSKEEWATLVSKILKLAPTVKTEADLKRYAQTLKSIDYIRMQTKIPTQPVSRALNIKAKRQFLDILGIKTDELDDSRYGKDTASIARKAQVRQILNEYACVFGGVKTLLTVNYTNHLERVRKSWNNDIAMKRSKFVRKVGDVLVPYELPQGLATIEAKIADMLYKPAKVK